MRRLFAIAIPLLIFCATFVAGQGPVVEPVGSESERLYPDSLRSVWLYTEGIKQQAISGDATRARELFGEAIRSDSTFAPAYYQLALSDLYGAPEQAVELARKAYDLDTTNTWYQQLFGNTLLTSQRYGEALGVYRRLTVQDAHNPDNYRILAALYEHAGQPYSALATLDSAELRFGRMPFLGTMKRQLLISTHQLDKALEEARAMVDMAPYDARNHVVLADLYAAQKRDSLALVSYEHAMQIDSTDIQTLMALSDYHNTRHDYRAMLDITGRLFASDDMSLDAKIERFERFTSDTQFYREHYFQLNALITTLAVRYPDDRRVAELYAKHLIATGELEQALAIYKLHLDGPPPVAAFYRTVIDIESYLQRPDSAVYYIDRAIGLFPEQVDFRLQRGHLLNYLKQYDKAVKAYRQSLRYAQTDSLRSAVWGLIGDTWHQKAVAGDNNDENYDRYSRTAQFRSSMKKCYAAYRHSLDYNPDNVSVLNNFAYFLSLEGRDLGQASAMAEKATTHEAGNPTYLDTYAWVLFKLGRASEAREIMRQAIALDNRKSPELLLHYGDILYALGENFMAGIYWEQARDAGYDAEQVARRLEQLKKQP